MITGKKINTMRRSHRNVSARLGYAPLLVIAMSHPLSGWAATAPLLGSAEGFVVLGAATVTNTGSTRITGSLGVSPGTAVTGFPPGAVTGGTIHKADAVALSARNSAMAAYTALNQPCTKDLTGQDLGGKTLVPGVYCLSYSAQLMGTLTLNAQGLANPVFIFKTGSTLTTASNSSVVMINGNSDCNVYWRIGSSATLGAGTKFRGNIFALASVTMTTAANLSGRAFGLNGAVTLDTNNVVPGSCQAASSGGGKVTCIPPTIKTISPSKSVEGGPAFKLTVDGANFAPGSVIQWMGKDCSGALQGTTQLTCSIPSTDIVQEMKANITVKNSTGCISAVRSFMVVCIPPTITSISPNTIVAGGPAFTLTVDGANFTPGSVIQWMGKDIPGVLHGKTQITCLIPSTDIAEAHKANITVKNNDGDVSAAKTFTITVDLAKLAAAQAAAAKVAAAKLAAAQAEAAKVAAAQVAAAKLAAAKAEAAKIAAAKAAATKVATK